MHIILLGEMRSSLWPNVAMASSHPVFVIKAVLTHPGISRTR